MMLSVEDPEIEEAQPMDEDSRKSASNLPKLEDAILCLKCSTYIFRRKPNVEQETHYSAECDCKNVGVIWRKVPQPTSHPHNTVHVYVDDLRTIQRATILYDLNRGLMLSSKLYQPFRGDTSYLVPYGHIKNTALTFVPTKWTKKKPKRKTKYDAQFIAALTRNDNVTADGKETNKHHPLAKLRW